MLHALDGGYIAAGPSGSPTRGLVNVLPTGRNFYSVDPKAIPSRLAWETGTALATSLLDRYRQTPAAIPRRSGSRSGAPSAMRTQGDDIAEVLALLGVRPVWDDASRRVTGFEVDHRSSELGRPRVDVTVRISGFFRDAFPHVIALLDDAIRAVAALDEPAEVNPLRAHVDADLAAVARRRGAQATSRIFGSKPGAYGAGLLPLIDARNWRSDADLAEVYAVWGGYAYGRGLDGRRPAREMETAFARIQVAAKNQDNREHDIVDSDDYFQYHGGMVAMVRHLTGTSPAAYVGDSHVPDAVRTRTLGEETHRVFRSRVVNPRWIAAMQRHGYKGAFEMAATVDYLFGYDATAGVVDDWMYESLAPSTSSTRGSRSSCASPIPGRCAASPSGCSKPPTAGSGPNPTRRRSSGCAPTYLELEGDLEGESALTTPYPFSAVVGLDDLRARAGAQRRLAGDRRGARARREGHGQVDHRARRWRRCCRRSPSSRGCRFGCDPAAPDPLCPDGPHPPAPRHRPARPARRAAGRRDRGPARRLPGPRARADAGGEGVRAGAARRRPSRPALRR